MNDNQIASLRSPFTDLLNIEEEISADNVLFHCQPRTEHLNSQGFVHGGVVLTLLDTAMASAARNYRQPLAAVTININCSFFRAASGNLIAQAKVVQSTTTMVFVEASLYNEQKLLIAKSSGTFSFIRNTDILKIKKHKINGKY